MCCPESIILGVVGLNTCSCRLYPASDVCSSSRLRSDIDRWQVMRQVTSLNCRSRPAVRSLSWCERWLSACTMVYAQLIPVSQPRKIGSLDSEIDSTSRHTVGITVLSHEMSSAVKLVIGLGRESCNEPCQRMSDIGAHCPDASPN